MTLTRSELDCRRFGIEVYRTVIDNEEDVRAAVGFDRASMIVARVQTSAVEFVQSLEAGGFFLTDTLVYFRGTTDAFSEPGDVEGLVIRDVTKSDGLEAVARKSFTNFFGHYHADPRIDSAVATEGYVEWSLSALDWTDGFVLGAFDDDALVGFATVRIDDDAAEIVLNGVAPSHQRRGVYGALVQTIGYRLREAGVAKIFSSTQIQNLGPQKTWARANMLPAESYYTLHRWRDALQITTTR